MNRSDKSDKGDDDEERLRALPSRVTDDLLTSRTVLVFGEITTSLARTVTAQLLALAAESDEPIRVIINSQGGHVESADTVHDVIRFIRPEVRMIGTGWVASAGAFIFVSAPAAHRVALPNTRFLLHQPLGGAAGQASDIEIEAAQILAIRERINRVFARETGRSYETISRETERNLWMTAREAREYGLISRIIERSDEL